LSQVFLALSNIFRVKPKNNIKYLALQVEIRLGRNSLARGKLGSFLHRRYNLAAAATTTVSMAKNAAIDKKVF
jgi:hypothetical protein